MGWLIGLLFGAGLVVALPPLDLAGWQIHAIPSSRRRGTARHWPAFIDDTASGLRAGLSVPHAVWQAGTRLPSAERSAFDAAASRWRAGEGLESALVELEQSISSLPFTQFVETLRVAVAHGGSRLPTLLAELAENLRNEQSLLDDVRGRQATTVNSAKVAVAAPWLVLAFTGSRADVRLAYASTTGVLVLIGVAWVCFMSYLAMRRLARLSALEVLK